jgi:hypothetical protein
MFLRHGPTPRRPTRSSLRPASFTSVRLRDEQFLTVRLEGAVQPEARFDLGGRLRGERAHPARRAGPPPPSPRRRRRPGALLAAARGGRGAGGVARGCRRRLGHRRRGARLEASLSAGPRLGPGRRRCARGRLRAGTRCALPAGNEERGLRPSPSPEQRRRALGGRPLRAGGEDHRDRSRPRRHERRRRRPRRDQREARGPRRGPPPGEAPAGPPRGLPRAHDAHRRPSPFLARARGIRQPAPGRPVRLDPRQRAAGHEHALRRDVLLRAGDQRGGAPPGPPREPVQRVLRSGLQPPAQRDGPAPAPPGIRAPGRLDSEKSVP